MRLRRRGGPRGPVVVREIGGWSSAVRSLRITGESVTEMTPGTTTIRHFGLRGEKLDIRFRPTIDSRGAFGKARAKYGILKAGIGLEGQERDLWAARRVPGW